MSMLTDFLDKMPRVGNFVEKIDLSKPASSEKDGFIKNYGKRVGKVLPNLLLNLSPWIYTGACVVAGTYGLGAYIGFDVVKSFRDNLKKNKLISDPVLSWYEMLGYDILKEEDYNKEKSKGQLSDENSVRALFKSIYNDK